MSELYPVMFSVMLVSVIVWFVLLKRLYKILELRHPEKFEAMGKPNLFTNIPPSSTFQLMRFLFAGEWRSLDDSGLASLSKFMVVFTFLYVLCFLTLFASISFNL